MPKFNTPMMKQYIEIKERYPDCILFFRLGDFYEMFLDDAHLGSKILDITLTARSRGEDGKIPMAGIPYHALDVYLGKLVKAGHKVAICEQLSAAGETKLVERDVVRIVTPGTLLDEKSLDQKENNYIVSLSFSASILGIASADISTGTFQLMEKDYSDFKKTITDEFAKINPQECVLAEDMYENKEILKELVAILGKKLVNHKTTKHHEAEKHLRSHFNVVDLEAYGIATKKEATRAASLLLSYLEYTQKNDLPHIKNISLTHDEKYVQLDDSTITNLELLQTLRGDKKGGTEGSLISILDETKTSMGGRLLKNWLLKPLTNKDSIEERQNSVDYFVQNRHTRQDVQKNLHKITDIERLASRIALGMGTPRDLVSLKNSLQECLRIKDYLSEKKDLDFFTHKVLAQIADSIKETIKIIATTVVDDPPIDPKAGKILRKGINADLDKLRMQVEESKKWLRNLEQSQKETLGIPSLKVRYNKVFGYYIEVSNSYIKLVPETFVRKQTLVNGERYITEELKQHEEIILSAEEKAQNIEYEEFLRLVEAVTQNIGAIQETAQSIAQIDCITNFSHLAETRNYIKPTITVTGEIKISEGRHPVVEVLMNEIDFVPNDLEISNGATPLCSTNSGPSLIILTGPNMAGKSVFIRQTALLVLLAQLGSFVPAESAEIGIVDKIFVRSGAADAIVRGLSTFMVEMVETANILNNVTDKSLVVMDEIGRGTSTYDGISIAAAIAEYLVKDATGPKTLFATHYHELEDLEKEFPKKIVNMQMAISDDSGEPVFLYKAIPGGSGTSYGIEVARLAGVPKEVTDNAYKKLTKLSTKGKPNGRN